MQRAVLGAAITAGLMLTLKPAMWFHRDGAPRIATWNARADLVPESVWVPWWGVVLGVALAIDLFF